MINATQVTWLALKDKKRIKALFCLYIFYVFGVNHARTCIPFITQPSRFIPVLYPRALVCMYVFYILQLKIAYVILRIQKTKEFIVRDHLNYFMENYYKDIFPVSSMFTNKPSNPRALLPYFPSTI